jgi:hypothetical protein
MFKNSKKQGDAGLGQAIAYFSMKGCEIALPLTDSTDWDLIIEDDTGLKRVQVKTSMQVSAAETEIFDIRVKGGNKSGSTKTKMIATQEWDLLFLHHLTTGRQAVIPKEVITSKGQINLSEKYADYVV